MTKQSSMRARLQAFVKSPRVRDVAYKVADILPERAGNAILRVGRRWGNTSIPNAPLLVGGPPPPKWFRISPEPEPLGGDWPEPPSIEDPSGIIRSVYETGTRPPLFDVALFEQLQEEYKSKPLVPRPPGRDPGSRADRARRRLANVHDSIGLSDRTVLEFGCGTGFEIWYLSHCMGTDAYGVDVVERKSWKALSDERTHFECVDITQKNPFAWNFFDRIMSFSVFEHVAHPYSALKELYSIMKPGGLAWISANLYRSAVASHLYHDIYFPFPHLLFTDEVFKEYFRGRGERERAPSWVNRLTWNEYERYIGMTGFRIKMLHFSERELDEELYTRFEDVLGRYPKWDLTKDFFEVILEKPL